MPHELQTLIGKIAGLLSKQPGENLAVSRPVAEELLRVLSIHRDETENHEELRIRLEEAEEIIEAIRSGDVDAIVRSGDGGAAVYTLEGPDHPYQKIVETMNAGAVTTDRQGTIFTQTAGSHK